ncbi:PD-(D/E)XK nuclease family protein [Chroococcidiopsis sp. CCMEE 29]|uniref:PD-(D/E)XK nuclease family protein n=1 Tax=Chroococcidiopsis sp. CCMEE 29 TaxID=155894 RepID=UPI0020222D61|nr:PD-(D/E)XK nuclease family protein [Chroococcidiopsis sp. CCMEE 29]
MRLSQGQLNLLERCPRQFQHTYLDQLGSPTTPEHQERQIWGSRFHLLMQQRELGLPIESLVQEDKQLQRWMTAFASAAPEILTPDTNSQTFRKSEHCRTLQVQDYLLTVIYDLLIADDRQAQILDWKTYSKPPNKRKLEQNWQTRLYLYVLAETSDYLPEQISMTYWFVQSEDKPQSLKFTYNNAQHQQSGQRLNRLLSQLTTWLQLYEQAEAFPQVAEGSAHCDGCQFTVRCDRERYSREETIDKNWLSNLGTIQEVSL